MVLARPSSNGGKTDAPEPHETKGEVPFTVVDWSQSALANFGVLASEDSMNIFKESDRPKVLEIINKVFAGEAHSLEIPCNADDGKEYSARLVFTPGFSHDSSEEKSASEGKEASEGTCDDLKVHHCFVTMEILSSPKDKASIAVPPQPIWETMGPTAFHVSHAALVISDMKGIIVHFNEAAVKLFGYEKEEAVGQNISFLMPAVFARRHERIFNERAKDMPVGEIRKLPIRDVFKSKEVIGQRKDKTLIPLSSQLCRMEYGGTFYVAASLLDLTDEKLAEQKKKIEKVLEKMLPKTLQLRLQRKETKAMIQAQFSKSYESATVFFSDIVGFTAMSSTVDPVPLVAMLNRLFSMMDSLAEKHGVEKIKTIGDAYMVVGGVPDVVSDHCDRVAKFALAVLTSLEEENKKAAIPLQIRIGIHTGGLVAGIIGQNKYMYDVFGNTVNVASRMESTGVAMRFVSSHHSHDHFFPTTNV
eukprot:TRINITY_DN2213_c0_g1_i7.p1 TRINITY_DN2213_c0_g1~~TRINITY_DN2213_c0_g1_i7.p1  ORF type:complete len:474 (+),score=136.17 TRINITY_DN2213_c0_g1_i7:289-1710(+)